MKEQTIFTVTIHYKDKSKATYKATSTAMTLEGRLIEITLENGDHVVININEDVVSIHTPKEAFPEAKGPLNSKAEEEIDKKIKDKKE